MSKESNDFIILCEMLGFEKEMLRVVKQTVPDLGSTFIREELEDMHRFLHAKGYGRCENYDRELNQELDKPESKEQTNNIENNNN